MIPVGIASGVIAFQAAVKAARPLRQAPGLQLAALVTQGNALLSAVDDALAAAGGPLDASEPAGHATALVAALNALATSAEDQRTLSDMRGFLGRAVLNLAQGVA